MARVARKHREEGFSLIEVGLVIFVLAFTTVAVTQLLGKALKTSSGVDAVSNQAFFEDLVMDRTTVLMQNLLFWLANVTNGCAQAGLYLHGTAPARPNPATIASSVADVEFSLQRFVWAGGKDPVDIARSGNGDIRKRIENSGGEILHELAFIDALPFPAGAGENLTALSDWYQQHKNNKALPAELAEVRNALNYCLGAYPVRNAVLSGKPKENADRGIFEFCLALNSSATPVRRAEVANGIQNTNKEITRFFHFVHIKAQLRDSLRNDDLNCASKGSAGDLIGGAINRSFYVEAQMFGVTDSQKKLEEQRVSSSERTFFVQKDARKLINCHNCDNSGDLVWLYECSIYGRCHCFCAFDEGSKQYYMPHSVPFGECRTLDWTTVQNICSPGSHYNF